KGLAVLAGLCLMATFSAFNAFAQPAPIPQTGMTVTYFPYDDGEYQAGVAWPDPRFTDNGDGTVKDNLTGLTWTKNANTMAIKVNWDAALAFCENLDLGDGGDDWRLPNIRELESILDWGIVGLTIPSFSHGHPFINAQADYYWASTSLDSSPKLAWTVFMGRGDASLFPKSASSFNYAWCISGDTSLPAPVPQTGQTDCYDSAGTDIDCKGTGQDGEYQAGVAWPDPRFTDHGDGTVTDHLTGRMWTKDAQEIPGTNVNENFDEAIVITIANEVAANFVFAGYDDWRMPNILELWSLIDFGSSGPALPEGHPFITIEADFYKSSLYWSNSMDQGGYWGPYYMGWGINMSQGYITSWFTSSAVRTWVVREATVPSGRACPLSKTINHNERVHTLRDLRDTRLTKSKGIKLVSMYYANASEISIILDKNPVLTTRLKDLVEENIGVVEALIAHGSAPVNKDGVEDVVSFLKELKKGGSKKLGKAVDTIIKGIRGGGLLEEVGLRIK
ncbi:MAG: DUF1566 domain-containing protein, partial [Gammaproteobacteria bacterium]